MSMFIIYKAEVENQLNKNIKILKFDRDGKYESTEFSQLCWPKVTIIRFLSFDDYKTYIVICTNHFFGV